MKQALLLTYRGNVPAIQWSGYLPRIWNVTLVSRYIARAIAAPFIGSLAVALMLLVIEEMTRLFTVLWQTGAPARLLWQMLACLMPEYLALAVPLALAFGILLAFRRMSLASEFDIFCCAGLALPRLLRTPYAYAVGCAAALLLIVGFIEPLASYRFESLGYTLDTGAFGLPIKAGEIIRVGSKLTIRVDGIGRDHSLHGIFVRSESDDGQDIVANAQSGYFLSFRASGRFILHLRGGQLIQDSPEFVSPRVLSFADYDLPLRVAGAKEFRDRGSRLGELTLPELLSRSSAASPGDRRSAVAELNGRLAQVFLAFLLPLLASAFGILPKGSGSAVGLILVTIAVVANVRINQYAVQVGTLGRVDPVVAVWLPFAALSILVATLFRAVSGIRDQCPVGLLQRFQRAVERLARSTLHLSRR